MQALPVLLPVWLAVFSAVTMLLLVTGNFYLPLLLGLGLPAATAVAWLARSVGHDEHSSQPGRRQLLIDAAVVTGIVLWAAWNIPLSSQHLLTNRDPATYAVSGAWLSTHHDLLIPKPASVSKLPGVFTQSYGFGNSLAQIHSIYAQGAHLLPALLGVVGKIAGLTAMLHANVIFGALALLAFYGFARALMRGGPWAALSTAVLAVSLPMIYFSRDTYTEPLTLLFVFSSLTLLLIAWRRQTVMPWALAGLAAGTTTLLRVDSYTFLAALAAYAVVYLAFAPADARTLRIRQVAALVVPGAALGILGWVDVTRLSSGYYHDLRLRIMLQLASIGVVALVGAVGVLMYWRTQPLHWWQLQMKNPWLRILFIALPLIFFALLCIRAGLVLMLTALGRTHTMPVATYSNDTTLVWVAWYIGPVLALGGILGFCYGWWRILMGQSWQQLSFLLIVGADCALYLLNPHIAPDQIWASRRLLPVIFPGFIVLGMLVLQYGGRAKGLKLWRFHVTRRVVMVVAALAVAGPLLTSLPFWGTRSFAELSLLNDLCGAVPSNALVVWVGSGANFAMQPTHMFCGVESVGTAATGTQLSELLPKLQHTAALGHKSLYLAADTKDAVQLPHISRLTRTATLRYVEPQHTFKRFPVRTVSHTQTFVTERVPQKK